MNGKRLTTGALVLAVLIASGACGKKAPPTMPRPEKPFECRVFDLQAEWQKGHIFLRGDIEGLRSPEEREQIIGARILYAEFPLDDAPCETCPVDYHGYHEYGSEVATADGFHCRVPAKKREHVYFLEVRLIGPEGVLGPSSNRVMVEGR
jgi:hypothetical protein